MRSSANGIHPKDNNPSPENGPGCPHALPHHLCINPIHCIAANSRCKCSAVGIYTSHGPIPDRLSKMSPMRKLRRHRGLWVETIPAGRHVDVIFIPERSDGHRGGPVPKEKRQAGGRRKMWQLSHNRLKGSESMAVFVWDHPVMPIVQQEPSSRRF
jgi:hypothetical protein